MCFSATVSYGAAAILIPTGLYSLRQSLRVREPYWMFAVLPLLFGVQQGLEGGVWQNINGDSVDAVYGFALGFLFFSHFFWLLWVPLSSSRIEPEYFRRRLFSLLAVLGGLSGAALFIPLLINLDWVDVSVQQHSIVYTVTMLHDDYLPAGLDRALYALVVLIPLLASSHRHVRVFGTLVAVSLLFAIMIYEYAFVSVWCFFAAALSLYLLRMFKVLQAETMESPG